MRSRRSGDQALQPRDQRQPEATWPSHFQLQRCTVSTSWGRKSELELVSISPGVSLKQNTQCVSRTEQSWRCSLPSCTYPPPGARPRLGVRALTLTIQKHSGEGFCSEIAASAHNFVCLVTRGTKIRLLTGRGDHLGRIIPKCTQRLTLRALSQISERFPHQNILVCHFGYVLNC